MPIRSSNAIRETKNRVRMPPVVSTHGTFLASTYGSTPTMPYSSKSLTERNINSHDVIMD